MYSELEKTEAIDLAEQAAAMLSLLPAVMRNLFQMDDDLATELPLAQLRVCSILREGPRPMSILSREMGVSLPAMTQIADRLERSRLVKRVSEGPDRRVRCLRLTPHGEHLMHRRDEEHKQSAQAVLEHLSPRARSEMLKSLDALLQACFAAKNRKSRDEAPAAEKVGA
ncbi:MAG: MarR family transcriptional regulator [Pirellulales bacterium]|nr:MarR family transcriptional regulator [Pirellulales bacterium]